MIIPWSHPHEWDNPKNLYFKVKLNNMRSIRDISLCCGQRLTVEIPNWLKCREEVCVERSDTNGTSVSPLSSKGSGTIAEEGIGKIIRAMGKGGPEQDGIHWA